ERGTARVEPRIAPFAPYPEARVEEHADPRPHRVELPHVAEVAEAREARAALAEDREGHPEVEARSGEAMRSLADEDPDYDGPGGRKHGRDARHPERERAVGRHAEGDGPGHERARRRDVREVAERARERADDEPGLDRDREGRAPTVTERPFTLERGQDRRGAEPES